MVKSKNIVILGRSGAGKGTQAQLLLQDIESLVYIATGDLFRDLATAETIASKKVTEVLLAGKFMPDDVAIAYWIHALCHGVKEGQSFILDGAPRTELQAVVLDRLLDFLGLKENTRFILLEVSREQAVRWLGERKRADDNLHAIQSRLDLFEKEVAPVIDYYQKSGRLARINGEQSIEDVHGDILKAIQ